MRMTLYARIAVLILTIVTVTSLAISLVYYESRLHESTQSRIESATTLTAAIAKSVFNDTLEGRKLKVRNTLRGIARGNEEISYILIIDFNGKVFASTFMDEVPEELVKLHEYNGTATGNKNFVFGKTEITDFAFPLIENLDAHIHIGYNKTRLDQSLHKIRLKTFWITLFAIVAGLLAAALAARKISRPLQKLADAVRNFGNGEPFAPGPGDKASPEMALLIDSFASMVEQRKKAEQELRIAASAFEVQEAIIITDAETNIISVNHAFTRITGYPAEEVIGKKPSMFKSGRHDSEFYRQMWSTLLQDGHWSGEIWDRRNNGDLFPKQVTITAVKSPEGITTHYVGSFIDITERKAAEERIFRLAYHDALTGLHNRLSLQERMQQLISLARRDGARISLLLMDLDHFKQVNDTLGHHIGDQLLIQVGSRLTGAVRESDIVARLGGDEFVVALAFSESDEMAEKFAAKLVERISEPYRISRHELRISPSIGICFYPEHGLVLDELIKHADVAMYQAKAAGRGCYRLFTPQMQIAATSRMVMEHELHRALDEAQFVLHYQPQMELRSGKIVSMEALVRWQHPQRGILLPDDFIPIAEEIGLIDKIDHWVISQAISQLQKWKKNGLGDIRISINISANQFFDMNLPEYIDNLARAAEIDRDCIQLEITETAAMASPDKTIEALHLLRNTGVRLAIDNFGTGYSSLAYLKLFRFDMLKIDRSFVKNIETDIDNADICNITVMMAHRLGYDVIAEGVENKEQLNYLLGIGCVKMQGYLFSRPLTADDAGTFIHNNLKQQSDKNPAS